MRLFVFGYRPYDEAEAFALHSDRLGVEIGTTEQVHSITNLSLARGYDAICITAAPLNASMLSELERMGIAIVITRTIGYDHIDLAAAAQMNIRICNATYSPATVAEYTVMMMLAALRRLPLISRRTAVNTFTLNGILGRTLKSCTVGIVGTGSIGTAVIEILQGFGCRILACSQSNKNTQNAEMVSFESLLAESDIISLHLRLTDATRHILDDAAFELVKPGALIVNTARGALIDTAALIRALGEGRIGGAALDVTEEEHGLVHRDNSTAPLPSPELSILKDMPNVLLTPHMAFYSMEAVEEKIACSIESFVAEMDGTASQFRVVL